ncbi:MAG TPA: YpiF family protein [Massilibacterium sp.]|nr:YpiF family protein [Massilibacterium sp.]
MKWKTTDIDIYFQAKEYVDTALIPMLPIGWGADVKTTVSLGEFIALFADELERQFKGRLVQFPSYTYLKDESTKTERLQDWIQHLKEEGFKHVILLTSDVSWKNVEGDLDGVLIWLPVLPLEHVDASYKQEMLTTQMKQIIQLIMSEWQKEKE